MEIADRRSMCYPPFRDCRRIHIFFTVAISIAKLSRVYFHHGSNVYNDQYVRCNYKTVRDKAITKLRDNTCVNIFE